MAADKEVAAVSCAALSAVLLATAVISLPIVVPWILWKLEAPTIIWAVYVVQWLCNLFILTIGSALKVAKSVED